ncbi:MULTISPECIES: S1C family serine protease [unclassified Herbaspirillum]|uniref:S1C family serine protease n=1 Tax=unclassified Herbaspirillum TaxID=2624150 RepID=UPI000C0B50B3|nr:MULTISPECIES: S1C family serine protease [unclassified Herbaspirillum]MAF03065.1 hypothetical protein [Herbaspirillum sp.]MBO15567.1 hypothetical protein [Herbaspirillum sp.]
MRFRLTKLLGLLGPLLAAAPPAHALDAETLFQQLSPSIWVVQAMDAQGQIFSTGSAVVIGPERLVTNCHVLARASSFKLRRGNLTLGGKLEFPDPERDLCQVRAEGMKAPAVTIAPARSLRVGQKVFTLGAPRALEETISDGLLSALRLDNEGKLRFLQTSAPISSGSSGGGLFNDKGELIGITTAMIAGATVQNLSFAVPAEWIRDLETRGRAVLAKRNGTISTPTAATPAPPALTQPPAALPAPAAPPVAMAPPAALPAQPVRPPAQLPPAGAAQSAPANPNSVRSGERWYGLMTCGARADNGEFSQAYQAHFEAEVGKVAISLHRRDAIRAENLTGQFGSNRLDITGFGYRVNDPDRMWQFRFTGSITAGAPIYALKGDMLRGQESVRKCELVIAKM